MVALHASSEPRACWCYSLERWRILRLATMSDLSVQTLASTSGDLHLRIVRPLVAYLAKTRGEEAVAAVARKAGLSLARLKSASNWVDHASFEALLTEARSQLASDAEFMSACVFEMAKLYGPLVLVLRVGSVRGCYEMMGRTIHMASGISKLETSNANQGPQIVLKYTSTKPESRLMCLSRQAQYRSVPTVWWGLSEATLEETTCIARGDDACTYRLAWSQPMAMRFPAGGAVLGALAALAIQSVAHPPLVWLLSIVGGALGAAYAYRLMVQDSLRFQRQTSEAVELVVKAHMHDAQELLDIHERQQAYSERLEERIAARTATLESMVNDLRLLRKRHGTEIHGISHDMRNPLATMLANAEYLSQQEDPELRVVGDELKQSVGHLRDQIRRLWESGSTTDGAFAIKRESLNVGLFAERLRRHVRAIVFGRNIRTTVFRTRESPDTITTDVLLFDRVVNNIVSNAAKYTALGSIIAEVGGTPGNLSIKISDTGRGISPSRLERVFVAGQKDVPVVGESWGIGLSNTIRLLDQLGGRLELMSKPGVGTTVWVHFPLEIDQKAPQVATDESIAALLKRIVTIRPSAN